MAKFDAKATAQRLIAKAELIGTQYSSVVMVPFTKAETREAAIVPRLSLGRVLRLDKALKEFGRGTINTDGTCMVTSENGPMILSPKEAEQAHRDAMKGLLD